MTLNVNVNIEEFRKAQRADGPATILAIGTANPSNCFYQADFPDLYFRITKSEHLTALKATFSHMCEKSAIKKRYMHLTEEILKENPNICEFMAPSLDARQAMAVVEVPRLGAEAASKAINEWGLPKSEISHLVFCTNAGADIPGADYQITKLLGLNTSIKRVMIYLQACSAGGTALRLAKDLAENNKGARVLVVCSEITTVTFRGPSASRPDSMVGEATFGDGAAAVIVGADPDPSIERPLFHIISAAQTLVPGSEGAIEGHLQEVGLTFHHVRNLPELVSGGIGKALDHAFGPLGITDWNSLFWVCHTGTHAILDKVQRKTGLNKDKLNVSRYVLSEYGNMAGASVLFVMDEMRKTSIKEGHATTGKGLDWGVLLGVGPGLTVETIVLRSVPIPFPKQRS